MVVVGSVHQLQCLGVLDVAVGQQGDSVSVYLSVCMCVCKHRVDLLWSVLTLGGWLSKKSSCALTAAFHSQRSYRHGDSTVSVSYRRAVTTQTMST